MSRFPMCEKRQNPRVLMIGLAAIICVPCLAQRALTPDGPALPSSSISPVMTPSTPAISTPAVAGSSSTNFSIPGLAQLLVGVKLQLEQALPVLNAFNNSFDFISAGSLTNTTEISSTGANFSSSRGANFSSSAGANLGSTVAVPTFNTQSGSGLNAFGLPPGLGVAPVTSETLRALLVLEDDIERMLPTLNVLTGSTNISNANGLTPGFSPGVVTNVFIVPSLVR